MRHAGTPIEITKEGTAWLRRVPLTERDLPEDWLQRLIQDHPSLMPVEEIRPSIGPSTALGREVVGQIIDHAAAQSRVSYEELDHAVTVACGGRRIAELVGAADADAQRLVDGIARSLRTGDLVLLVVGDGIRESVVSMGDLLGGAPHLAFTFGLIELAVYRSASGARVVVPSVDPATFTDAMAWRDSVAADSRLRVDHATASMIFRIRPDGFNRNFTGLVIGQSGTAAIGWLHGQIAKVGAPPSTGGLDVVRLDASDR